MAAPVAPAAEWLAEPSEALLLDVRRMLLDQVNNRLTVLLAVIQESRPGDGRPDRSTEEAREVARSISRAIEDLSLDRLAAWRSRYGEMVGAAERASAGY